ncbi:MAG: 4-alpha-glucanotransferase, partial [Vicinamibacteria bacterium]|nr:4-alpha-glucanotransferase [Vicinamibacteria bacterium]
GRDTRGAEIHWDLIRLAFMNAANTAIVPLQDIMGLGSSARMNMPGTAQGNWEWRYDEGDLTDGALERLADLTDIYGRTSEPHA